MKSYKDRILHVEFPEEEVQTLLEWKRKVLSIEGQGAIKNRTIKLIKSDLINLK